MPENNIVLLSATAGTSAVLIYIILYIKKLKKKLRHHVLRKEKMQKYLEER